MRVTPSTAINAIFSMNKQPRTYAAQIKWLESELSHTRANAEGRRHMLECILATVKDAQDKDLAAIRSRTGQSWGEHCAGTLPSQGIAE